MLYGMVHYVGLFHIRPVCSVFDHHLSGVRNVRCHIVRASHKWRILLAHDNQGRNAYVWQVIDHARVDLR
jgi:hypothetical protein